MASPAVVPDYSTLKLSTKDAWILYRLAYFPRVAAERRRAMLDEEGVTAAGRRIGQYLLGDDVAGLTETERFVGERYKSAAYRDRLSLPSMRDKVLGRQRARTPRR